MLTALPHQAAPWHGRSPDKWKYRSGRGRWGRRSGREQARRDGTAACLTARPRRGGPSGRRGKALSLPPLWDTPALAWPLEATLQLPSRCPALDGGGGCAGGPSQPSGRAAEESWGGCPTCGVSRDGVSQTGVSEQMQSLPTFPPWGLGHSPLCWACSEGLRLGAPSGAPRVSPQSLGTAPELSRPPCWGPEQVSF